MRVSPEILSGRRGWAGWLAAALLAGCADDGTLTARSHDPTLDGRLSPGAPAARTDFDARSISVHPLTRQIDPGGASPLPAASSPSRSGADLEVRIECLDRDSIDTRSVGLLWLELEAGGERWTVGPVNLTDAATNLEFFEAVTRTYRINVRLPERARPAPGSAVIIEAFLRLPSGPLLQDRRELPWR